MKLETWLNIGLLVALGAALAYPIASLFAAEDGGSHRVAEQITSAGLVSGAMFLIARKVACGT